MKTNSESGQDFAVNEFLEVVARCLAKRWLKLQRQVPKTREDPQLEAAMTSDRQPHESTSNDDKCSEPS